MPLPLLGIIARLAMSAPAVGRAVAGVAARSAARGLSATGATLARLGATVGASSIASVIANRITEATANTSEQTQQDTQSDTPAEAQAAALEVQPQDTSVEKVGSTSDGDVGSKLAESPVINLLRSINDNQKELVNTIKTSDRRSTPGTLASALRQARPTQVEQVGLGGSLALLLGAAIAGGFTEITSRFSQFINGIGEAVQSGISGALNAISESISEFFSRLFNFNPSNPAVNPEDFNNSEDLLEQQRRSQRAGENTAPGGINATPRVPTPEEAGLPPVNTTGDIDAARRDFRDADRRAMGYGFRRGTPQYNEMVQPYLDRFNELQNTQSQAQGGDYTPPPETTPDQNAAIERAFRSAETAQASAAAAAAQQNPQRVVPGSEEDLRLQEQADREEATQRGRSQSSPGWFSRFVNTLTGRDAQLQQRSDTFVRGNRSLAAGMDEEMRSLSNIMDTSEEARDRMSQTINNSGGVAQPNVIINQTTPQTQQEPNIIPAPQASQSMSTPGSRTAAVSLGSYPRLLNQSPAFAG